MPLAGKLADLKTAMGQARLSVRVRKMLGVEEDPNLKVGINGFGRLGRMLATVLVEAEGIDLVAINDPFVDPEYMAYMLQQDGAPNGFHTSAEGDDKLGQLRLDGKPITVFSSKDPSKIDWFSAGAVYIIEASGRFTSAASAAGHLEGGAQHVVVAAPLEDCPQLLVGVNHEAYAGETVISAGSACAHALAYLLTVLEDACGEGGIAHACASVLQASSDIELEQVAPGPQGANSSDWRSSMRGNLDTIPRALDALADVRAILPTMATRLGGSSFRVPSPVRPGASCIDLTLMLDRPTELARLRTAMRVAAQQQPLRGRVGYRDDDVSAADFAIESRSVIFDGHASLQHSPSMLKVIAWYPHEWAYCRRLMELLYHMHAFDYGAAPEGESTGAPAM